MRFGYIFVFISLSCSAQSLTETQKLASLGEVWGFLKYYHPAVATGRLNWDEQLVTLVPQIQQAHDRNELSTIYLRLIDNLGIVTPCQTCSFAESIPIRLRRNFDLSLLNDSTLFSTPLRDRLHYIARNRNQGKNHYVQWVRQTENANYSNEKTYAEMRVPNEAYRLLTLFRYWNVVHYFFPYKYAIDKNWHDVLMDQIPVFQQANSEQAYQLALYRMVAQIQDSHGFVSNTNKSVCLRCDLGRNWVPFEMTILDDKAIITRFYNDSLAAINNLKIGMVISHIDGETIHDRLERERPYVAASNESALRRNIAILMGIGPTEKAKLTIETDGQDSVLIVQRYAYSAFGRQAKESINSRNPVSRWLPNSIGYVNMGRLAAHQVDSVINTFMVAKAILFDVRHYPQGTMGQVLKHLNVTDKFVQFIVPDLTYPGMMKPGPVNSVSYRNKVHFKGKVIVLQNEETQSQAEFTIMALQTVPNVIVIGSQTAGADGGYIEIPLPGGYLATMTGQGIYYPDGRETQRIGIVPDVVVRPTIRGIQAGRDEVLERAIEAARQKK
ncbi:S41 family peptidase [Spirosoma endophyticum]|uniref:C-terminal processing protease CtpA/Prc, contains a PDZ domain n=1 Tax=Spirosoma endophyticum TaxID=662367 RepID=A0A1I2A957_9BACT|nr:S41 family peptidase [Spirosoma endophyticum]SFE40128.1 C-terminal processing protease CtpA/Prc, contains a PDZ domain [Spirosoma endophyticum]